jgi:hypothetical protein
MLSYSFRAAAGPALFVVPESYPRRTSNMPDRAGAINELQRIVREVRALSALLHLGACLKASSLSYPKPITVQSSGESDDGTTLAMPP